MTIRLCTRCVNPSTRPNIELDEDGICTVCRFEEAKRSEGIDWEARRRDLEEISAWSRRNIRSAYDCIVTVSGGAVAW